METVLALDVGGTKVAAGVVDADGRLLARAARPTPAGRRRRGGAAPPSSTRSTEVRTGDRGGLRGGLAAAR